MEAFTVGLIQDIGSLFLAFLHPDHCEALQSYCKTILKDAKGKYEWFHAVTDVHLDTGETGWIEPQTGEEIDLDFDGDGHVNTVPRGDITKGPSEGCYSVETFESWEDAKKTYGWK